MPGYLNFIILILWLKILKCNSIDVNLVLQLKEIFQSDVILIVKDGVNDGTGNYDVFRLLMFVFF